MADDKPQHLAAWITPQIAEERALSAAPFKRAAGEIEELHETGAIDFVPLGKRILVRAVLAADAYAFAHGAYDARQAIVHKVLALGDGVERYWNRKEVPVTHRFAPGDLVYVLSTVADRMSKTDKACRLWTVDVRDVSGIVKLK